MGDRGVTLEQLIESVTVRSSGTGCWAERVDGLAKEFLDVLEGIIAGGGYVNKEATAREFKKLGVSGDVGRHLRGVCKCQS